MNQNTPSLKSIIEAAAESSRELNIYRAYNTGTKHFEYLFFELPKGMKLSSDRDRKAAEAVIEIGSYEGFSSKVAEAKDILRKYGDDIYHMNEGHVVEGLRKNTLEIEPQSKARLQKVVAENVPWYNPNRAGWRMKVGNALGL